MDNGRNTKFSGIAAAIELVAVLAALVAWFEASAPFAAVTTAVSLLVIACAITLRRFGFAKERARDKVWLKARAVVDEQTTEALEEYEIPPAFVRAVENVGNQKTLRIFRMRIKKECGPELKPEQLTTILRAARVTLSVKPDDGGGNPGAASAVVKPDGVGPGNDGGPVANPMEIGERPLQQ